MQNQASGMLQDVLTTMGVKTSAAPSDEGQFRSTLMAVTSPLLPQCLFSIVSCRESALLCVCDPTQTGYTLDDKDWPLWPAQGVRIVSAMLLGAVGAVISAGTGGVREKYVSPAITSLSVRL